MPITLQQFHAQTHSTELLPQTLQHQSITGLSLDSRLVTPGSVFLAIAGEQTRGYSFINQALQQGAIAVYTDQPLALVSQSPTPCFFIPNLKAQLPALARFFYGDPSASLEITAVTGTNGKSSTAYLLSNAQDLLGAGPGYYIGTIGHGSTQALQNLDRTTPDVITVNYLARQALEAGARYLNLEASSHGLHQGRLDGLRIKNAVFSNLTHDHLNYHGTMEDYFQAKMQLFLRPELENVVVNLDDPYTERVLKQLAPHIRVLTTSLKKTTADVYAHIVNYTATGMKVEIILSGQKKELTLPIIAEFQLANLVNVLGVLSLQGFSPEHCFSILPKLKQVPGRMERWELPNGAVALIDYAHTPDALLQALKGLKERAEQVICVFGCGGEKDREKRPKMAAIVESLAHIVIVTSDNPRYEPFEQIVNDMRSGFRHPEAAIIEPDRRLAILEAIKRSRPHTVIVLAGKGHETFMEIQGIKSHFDERDVLTGLREVTTASCKKL